MKRINLGRPLVQLQTVDSTNHYASRYMRQGPVTEGTVILAEHQTSGRGQGGSQWVSEKGSNLLFSIILKPDFLPAYKQFYLSMSVATGIHHYISGLGIHAVIKWPNDLFIRGKKVAGILIENTILAKYLNTSVIGIGLNVNQRIFPDDIPGPTSLSLETGASFDLSESLKELLICLESPLNNLYQGKFAMVRSAYLNHLWLLNTPSVFTDRSGTFKGRIVDVADTGELLVAVNQGEIRSYGFKDVTFQEEV